MKNNKQNSILMGVTAVCVAASLILCGFVLHFNKVIRAAQDIQLTARDIQRVQFERGQLLGELQEYSKRNPDFARVLGQPPAPAKPATK